MKKRLLALGTALCLLLGGCGKQAAPDPAPSVQPSPPAGPVQPEAKPFALPLDPDGSWDPYQGSRSGNLALAGLLYEGLYALDRSFAPQPVLAKSATASEDGLVWTIVVRSGVSFANGEALTAQAAGEAFNAARGDKSIYAARFKSVKRVSWDKEQTLTVTLSAPNARFPALLDFPVVLVTKEGVWGTGPYVLGEGRLTARPDWWQGKELPLQDIPLVEAGDADALITAFNTGELGLVAVDPTGPDALGYSEEAQTWEYPTSNMLYLGFQCARGPCRSPEFRRAVSQALDRGALVGQCLEGHARPAALPAPAGTAGYDAQAAQALERDITAAGETLEELGYKLGEDGGRLNGRQSLKLSLVVNSDNAFKERLAQGVSDALGELGIAVEVRALTWEEYKKALEKGDFDLYLAEYRLTGDLDPSPLLTAGSGLAYGGFRDNALSQALAQARAEGEWGPFYTRWAQQVPVAVICFKTAQLLTQWGRVTGANPTQGDLFYQLEGWHIG